MAQDLRYDLYDTAFFGTAASTLFSLFQSAQGSQSTLTKSVTNSRGAGQLPSNESFAIDWIGTFLDEVPNVVDAQAVWIDSYCEIRVNDETVLLTPLRRIAACNSWGGHFGQAAAANLATVGLMGDGYKLDNPIEIPGGTSFRVDIFQGTALSAITQSVRFVMSGILGRN